MINQKTRLIAQTGSYYVENTQNTITSPERRCCYDDVYFCFSLPRKSKIYFGF